MSLLAPPVDELPPFRVPLRFFLTAPLFGIAAGALWLAEGEAAFALRWAPGLLAATHLWTLGFLAMVMVGALFQVVPVLGGGPLPQATRIAPVVHAALTGGAACLAIGLYDFTLGWLAPALALLATAFAVFVPALALRVLRRHRGSALLYSLRFAVLSLLVVVLLGLWLLAAVVWPGLGLGSRVYTDVHAAWGLGGFVLLLLVGVGHQVIPMFHVTPAFPKWQQRTVAPLAFAGLVLLSLPAVPAAVAVGGVLLAAACLLHTGGVASVLHRRKRRRAEPAVRAWQLSLLWLLLAVALLLKLTCLPSASIPGVLAHQEPMLLAVAFALGCAGTVITGMLGKIVAFLGFTHLQRRCLQHPGLWAQLPTLHDLVPERRAWLQLGLHTVATVLVATAVLWPAAARMAGGALALANGTSFLLVLRAAMRYRQVLCSLRAQVAAG